MDPGGRRQLQVCSLVTHSNTQNNDAYMSRAETPVIMQIRRGADSRGVRGRREVDYSGRDVPLTPDSVIITAEATKPESPLL